MSTSSFTLGQAVKRFSATRGKRLPGQSAKLGRRELGKSCREEELEDAGKDKTKRESEGALGCQDGDGFSGRCVLVLVDVDQAEMGQDWQ